MDVEHTAAFRVGERADAVFRRQTRKCGSRLAAPAQNYERDPFRNRHEHARAFAIGRADEPDGAGGQTRVLEGGPQNVVDENRDRAQRRSSGAQDRRVEALQQLTRDVEGDVGTSFEVRADGPDRNATLADLEPVRQRPGVDLAFQRRDRRHRLDLLRECLYPLVVEPEAVEHPLVQAPCGLVVVDLVRAEDLGPALAHKSGRGHQGLGDAVVGEARGSAIGRERLALHLLAQRHRRHPPNPVRNPPRD